MKKLFLIIATTLMTATVWAQSPQLITVKGKTKEGKNLYLQYYKGTAQDRIESLEYQEVNELKADNKKKQNTINDLQYQLNKANKTIKELNEKTDGAGDSNQIAELEEQLSQKQRDLEQLNDSLQILIQQLSSLQTENENLQRQNAILNEENAQLRQKKSRLAMSPVIGVEAGMGGVLLSKSSLNNPWEKALSWNKQVDIYFGTGSLSEGLPLSVEAGIGFRNLPMKAGFVNYMASGIIQDCDGDQYQPIFDNCSEKLTINCLEVPVRICIGQPDKNKVSVYGKLGVTPSFILASKLTNTYSKTGFYPQWNVTIEDVEELGFNSEEGNENMTSSRRFNVWGNVAFGAYVPLSSSILFNIGAKLDCPILTTGNFKPTSNMSLLLPDGYPIGLERYNGRMLIPSLQAGVVYSLR